jgi:transposase-like protein
MKVKVIKMENTSKRYEPEFKKKMVRLVLEEGRTIASVNKEYSLGYNGLIN